MSTQSIDLSAVKNMNFNGTEIKTMNLNGSEIWKGGPATYFDSITAYDNWRNASATYMPNNIPPQSPLAPIFSSGWVSFHEGNIYPTLISSRNLNNGLVAFGGSDTITSLSPSDSLVLGYFVKTLNVPYESTGWIKSSRISSGTPLYLRHSVPLIELDGNNLIDKTLNLYLNYEYTDGYGVQKGTTATAYRVLNNTITHYSYSIVGQHHSPSAAATIANGVKSYGQYTWNINTGFTHSGIQPGLAYGTVLDGSKLKTIVQSGYTQYGDPTMLELNF